MTEKEPFHHRVGQWVEATPAVRNVTLQGCARHLQREVNELRAELRTLALAASEHREEVLQKTGEELADVLILTCHLAHKLGLDLMQFGEAKLAKNWKRKWGAPDEQGVVHHTSEGDDTITPMRAEELRTHFMNLAGDANKATVRVSEPKGVFPHTTTPDMDEASVGVADDDMDALLLEAAEDTSPMRSMATPGAMEALRGRLGVGKSERFVLPIPDSNYPDCGSSFVVTAFGDGGEPIGTTEILPRHEDPQT